MRDTHIEIVFLVFIIMLVSSIVYRMSNRSLVVSLAAVLVALGIYKSQKPSRKCRARPTGGSKTPTYISKTLPDTDGTEPTYSTVDEAANQYSEREGNEFERQLYANLDAAEHNFYDTACPGDNLLSLRMWENGKRSKTAMDNRAKFDKYSFLHYVDEELRTTAESIWWDDDSLEHLF